MQKDEHCTFSPRIRNSFNIFRERKINMENYKGIDDSFTLEIEFDNKTVFVGVMTHPILLFHSDVFDIAESYEPSLPCKRVLLANFQQDISQFYAIPFLRKIPCLSEQSVFNPIKKRYDKIVLNGSKIKNKDIFLILENKNIEPIVSLDFAESVLRRNIRGLQFKEVEVI